MKILVTGGAGYIGSHMNIKLEEAGHDVCVIDNLSHGHISSVKKSKFFHCDINDSSRLDEIFSAEKFDIVFHFAGLIDVSESMQHPTIYYENNVNGTKNLLSCMMKHGVRHIIFSSTAAVYGIPKSSPIKETHPTNSINPYGESKLLVENILADYQKRQTMNYICLRYFNAAGADYLNHLGECHDPETHLIPLVLQAASGRRKSISIYGNDYDTLDGTCIRDYIHVSDLCDAHLLAMDYLMKTRNSCTFNLGNGEGFSVRDVINTAKKISGKTMTIEYSQRRAGDPDILVADANKAKTELNWQPSKYQLHDIISDAWQWEQILARR